MDPERRVDMPQSPFLTAQEAAAELGVKLPTLYSYVSRGLIRSEASGNILRERRYYAEDVQRLKERQEQRRDPTSAVSGALHWGAPLLESALTLIHDGKLYYRGYEAVKLASQHNVEEVVGLLWKGNLQAKIDSLNKPVTKSARVQMERLISLVRPYPLIESFQIALLMTASEDPMAYDLRPGAVEQTGGRILRLLTSVAAGRVRVEESGIAQTLAQSWMPDQPSKATRLLNAALILLADHEFNVSSFTARCVASAGATPYEVVTAGLAALQGAKHGGAVNRVEALLDEIQRPANAPRILSRRLKRGDDIPGFGHRLYPEGDPRARALLKLMADTISRSPALSLSRTVIQEAKGLIGEEPNSDFALAVLARLLKLPEGYGLGIFALSRTIGWLAHAMEQYQSNRIIRPRARYVGQMPHAD
jgi:citrate synthase